MTPNLTAHSMTSEQLRKSGREFAEEMEREFIKEIPADHPSCRHTVQPWCASPVLIPAREMLMACVLLPRHFEIDRVIFHDPATIVYWQNGDKTVVKCQPGDTYSKEAGLALAFMKRALGNKGNFNDVFRKWVDDNG